MSAINSSIAYYLILDEFTKTFFVNTNHKGQYDLFNEDSLVGNSISLMRLHANINFVGRRMNKVNGSLLDIDSYYLITETPVSVINLLDNHGVVKVPIDTLIQSDNLTERLKKIICGKTFIKTMISY